MFLTLSAEDVSVGNLRLRLPAWPQARKTHWEQHPANVLEASYVNLSFALVQSGSKKEEAIQVLEEGVALMPSSLWLKHALGRMHLHLNRYDLAEPIYEDISLRPILDRNLANEIRAVLRTASRRSPGRRRGNR